MTPTEDTPKNITAVWEITSQCNLRCPHCYTAASAHRHQQMDTGECKQMIDSMAGIGVELIGWTGGEPLLRRDLCELTAYAREKKIRSNVTTNGVLLDRRWARAMAESGMRAVQISLDGSTPERNRRMRGATDEEYARVLDGIRFCKEENLAVFLACVLGEENLDDGPRMIELAAKQGADSIRFCSFTPVGRGRRQDVQDRLSFTHPDRLLDFVLMADRESPIPVDFDASWGPVPPYCAFHECKAGVNTFYMKEDGDMYPCSALTHRKFRVGNVRTRPLAEIWASPEMRAVSSLPRDKLGEPCASCDNIDNCHGACRGASFAHTGSLDAVFPMCLYPTLVRRLRSEKRVS